MVLLSGVYQILSLDNIRPAHVPVLVSTLTHAEILKVCNLSTIAYTSSTSNSISFSRSLVLYHTPNEVITTSIDSGRTYIEVNPYLTLSAQSPTLNLLSDDNLGCSGGIVHLKLKIGIGGLVGTNLTGEIEVQALYHLLVEVTG